MSRHCRMLAALVLGCALLAGCGGGGRGQPSGGIHAKLAYSEGGGLRVVEAPAGGGADLAGIRANDVIIAINGTSVRELDYQTIVEKLRGPVGSNVQLDVFRGGEVRTVSVMRQAYTK
ncbi:MAG: PDZ domain-containing protein [Deltaproteobacteria bacterium]|nr:PDZ domain-containing protein [Deltaproteobacteria bacterium]MBW2376400.1 PDZ domain-containing protein [Deltaproteobacteria bacterium]